MQTIDASPETLAEQAPKITAGYMHAAQSRIDELFGNDYARRHPSLVGSFIAACAADVAAVTIAQQVRAGLREIAEAK